ncbi:SpoIIE family protein phosphatase [Leptospira stimsonii]|uniref:GAF domain-containing protein n=1 Tax=Leptospira stimsonii TaxID=2202203 RepID=A0A4R9LA00_9LEPT|nr:SpoIIE family protein phosphatase [Leptospira stimsonii]RHX83773.1 serine/threonine protein phosphatase [Leptospira stimsonii]TGK18478.1 GAF domain-containing protein [Leptospira stimsonii]TGM21882.1 GAF domain-containing protein [Leptospira stimsonii]
MIELKLGQRKVVSFRGNHKVVGGLTEKNKIDILLYISKEFASVDKHDELYNSVTNICKDIFECDNTTLRIWKDGMLVPVRYLRETTPPRRSVTVNEGYSGHTFKTKTSLLVQNLSYHPEYIDEGESTLSVMCVPILYKDEVLGTIAVESEHSFFYIEDDIEILEALASQLALALTSVRLIEGLVEANQREAGILKQLEFDMKMGRNVQSQIINTNIAPWNGIHFGTYYEPMTEVSGDYFDVVRHGNAVTVIIADVSGHGIPAALVTMSIHYQFRRCTSLGLGLTEILTELGESIRPQLPEGTYFTAFILRIYGDYSYSYVNGAHQKLIHFRNDTGVIDELDSNGVPMGIFEVNRNNFEEKQGRINPGDILILTSDGIVEQKNPERQELGNARFLDWVRQEKQTLEEQRDRIYVGDLVDSLISRFKRYKGEARNGDDISIMALQCNPLLNKAKSMMNVAKTAAREKNDSLAYDKALDVYSLDDSIKDSLLLLGRMYYRDRNFPKAIQFLDKFVKTSGEDSAYIHYLIGRAYYETENVHEAKRSLKRSLAIDHTYSKASLRLARCYLKDNQSPKAIKVLQQGIKSAPTNEYLKISLKKLEDLMRKKEDPSLLAEDDDETKLAV